MKTQNEQTNETAYASTDNLADFWAAGGDWSMDRYISELKKRGDLYPVSNVTNA